MFAMVLIIICTLIIAREIAGYDSRYNDRKFFVLQNKKIAKILLPKSVGFQRGVKRKKDDFNKMTYIGASFYLCNLLLFLIALIFLLFIPEIKTTPFELESKYLYIFVDTINEKIPILLSFVLLTIEIVFEFINIIIKAKKENKKGMIILSSFLIFIILLFGLFQLYELVLTTASLL